MKIVFYPQVIFMLHIFCIEYCLGSSNSFTCTNTMRQSLSRVYFFLRKYNLLRQTSWNGGLCSSFRDRYKVENMKYFLDQTYFYLVSIVMSYGPISVSDFFRIGTEQILNVPTPQPRDFVSIFFFSSRYISLSWTNQWMEYSR